MKKALTYFQNSSLSETQASISMMDPYISGRQLASDIRNGKISSLDATKFFIERIEQLDHKTNLVVVKIYDNALKRAHAADEALRRGEIWGPLHGVPMTVKECFVMKGVQTTSGGFKKLLDYKPTENAAIVKKLLEAGAVIMGKTNMPVLGGDLQTYNSLYGTSRNPWNLELTPGGSSGGAAGALAAGFTPLEVGSDIGGSIRTPAHFSGVCGHKPTFGIVDKFGHCPPYPFSVVEDGLFVVGPLARNCDDLEMLLEILCGPPKVQARGWKINLPPPIVTDVAKLKIALWADDEYCRVESEYVLQIEDAAKSLHKHGATIVRSRPDFEFKDAISIYGAISLAINTGKPIHPKWTQKRELLKQKWEEFWNTSGCTALLCPVVCTSAIKIDESGDAFNFWKKRKIQINGETRLYLDLLKWAGVIIIADLPSTVVPIGILDSGVPVGVQIVGPMYHDKTTLQVGRMLERVHAGSTVVSPPGYKTKNRARL